MKQLSFLFTVVCLSLLGWANAHAQSTDTTADPNKALEVDRDTINAQLNVGAIGDCISGMSMRAEGVMPPNTTPGAYDLHPYAFRWYQVDRLGNKVAQVVVLKEQWPGLPADLLTWSEKNSGNQTFTGKAGFKVAALTPKELAEAKYHGEVWGEVFEACYPKGLSNANRDTMPNYPGYEIICYSDSIALNQIPKMSIEHRRHSRELMIYTDNTGLSYLVAAPNKRSTAADYTPGASGGKYNSRWIVPSKREEDYWWDKYLRYIKKQNSLKNMKEL